MRNEPNIQNSDMDVLVLTTTGQDFYLAEKVLNTADIKATGASSIDEFAKGLELPVGAVIIAEEAINKDVIELIDSKLPLQAPWSDLPIILLTLDKKKFGYSKMLVDHFGTSANLSLLERPFSKITLVTMVQAALRARRKQYQVRDLLLSQSRALNIRNEFLSIASHELKTPLTTIKLQAQLRKHMASKGIMSYYSEDKVDSFLDMIEKQTNRLVRLVDDMLDVTKIENGKLAIQTEYCNLKNIVDQTIEAFGPQIAHSSIQVALKVERDVTGEWDKYRIEQVFVNLFTNALKYGNDGPIVIEAISKPDLAILTVKDCGIGIKQEDMNRVFDRFERAVVGTNISGLGLGLFISKQIVEMHGGTLSVESTFGEGSTFRMVLPKKVTT